MARERAAGALAVAPGLVGDFASILGTQVATIALQLCSGVLLARMLGPVGRGTYAIVVLVPATVVAVGGLGMGTVLTHWAARGLAPARTLLGNALLLAGVLGVGYAAGLHLVLDPAWPWLQGADAAVLALACASVPFLLFNDHALAILLGHGRVATRNAARLAEAGTLFALVLLLALGGARGVLGATLAWTASVLVVSVIASRACVALAGGRPRASLAALRPAMAKGLQGALGPACTFLLLRSDLYLVAHFLGASAAGHYAVAASVAGLVLLAPTAVGSALLPRVSRAQDASARRLSAAVCRVTALVTLAGCLALAAVARPAIVLLYGAEFAAAVAPLLWLLPGVAAAAVALVLATDLQGRGVFHVGSIASGSALALNLALNAVAIPRWGLAGAAVSSSLAYAIAAGVVIRAYARGAGVRWHEPLLPRAGDLRALLGTATSRSRA